MNLCELKIGDELSINDSNKSEVIASIESDCNVIIYNLTNENRIFIDKGSQTICFWDLASYHFISKLKVNGIQVFP